MYYLDKFFWGKRGSGKTFGAVKEAWLNWLEGYGIWSNTWLHPAFDVNYVTKERGNLHYVDAIDLIKMLLDEKIPEYKNPQLLILDEIKSQANARNFGSFINKHLADFVSQARKRNFTLCYTDQILGAYDRWIRLMTDKIIRCVPYYYSNKYGLVTNASHASDLGRGTKEYPEPMIFEYIEIDLTEDEIEQSEPLVYDISRKTARHFYPLYKTNRIVTPVELKYSNINEMVAQ